jgi:hypothetical protein
MIIPFEGTRYAKRLGDRLFARQWREPAESAAR